MANRAKTTKSRRFRNTGEPIFMTFVTAGAHIVTYMIEWTDPANRPNSTIRITIVDSFKNVDRRRALDNRWLYKFFVQKQLARQDRLEQLLGLRN